MHPNASNNRIESNRYLLNRNRIESGGKCQCTPLEWKRRYRRRFKWEQALSDNGDVIVPLCVSDVCGADCE